MIIKSLKNDVLGELHHHFILVKEVYIWCKNYETAHHTAQKMKFSIKDFFSKCDQIRRKLRIWSHLLNKSLMENFIFVQCHSSIYSYDELVKKQKILARNSINESVFRKLLFYRLFCIYFFLLFTNFSIN